LPSRVPLVPTRCVGMPSRRATPRITGNASAYTGRSASSTAFPRSTWERDVLEHLCIKTNAGAWERMSLYSLRTL
jgi:hypothetical protein